jgi:hypothetical protein
MQFTPEDAEARTGFADTWTRRERWARIANMVWARTGDRERAIKIANEDLHFERQRRLTLRLARRSQPFQLRLF